jgi:hypothetical protein
MERNLSRPLRYALAIINNVKYMGFIGLRTYTLSHEPTNILLQVEDESKEYSDDSERDGIDRVATICFNGGSLFQMVVRR